MSHAAMAFIPSKYKYVASMMNGYTFPLLVTIRPIEVFMNDAMKEQQFFSELLRKNPFIGDPKSLEKVTCEGFISTELRCYNYNTQFQKLLDHPYMGDVLRKWKENVAIILHRPFSIRVPRKITAGATTSCKTGNTPLERFKTSEITPECLSFFMRNPDIGMPLNTAPTIRNGSISHQVPKTYKTNRLIALEPSENILLQSDIGSQMSELLSYQGIEISKAQEVHKAYAWLGSITGEFSTDDLTSASNLIYSAIARYLLPSSWREACDAARSSHIIINDECRELQAYATNGNGFCFELETILFYAMLQTAHTFVHGTWSDDCRVYGDDLIYPVSITDTVRRICKGVGFITNLEKSFSHGLFRESCGGDFINGVDVRPVFLKNRLESTIDKIIHLNQIYNKFGTRMPKLIRKYYFAILRSIPIKDRLYGPDNASGALHFPKFWREKPNKWGVARYQEWRYTANDMTSYGHIARGVDPNLIMWLATGRYLKDQGGHRLKPIFHGPGVGHDTLKSLRLYPQQGKEYDIKYPLFPAPGTSFRVERERSLFFKFSQEDDPLLVLDALREAGNPLMQSNYYYKVIRPKLAAKVILQRDFVKTLHRVLESKKNIYARQSVDIDLEI